MHCVSPLASLDRQILINTAQKRRRFSPPGCAIVLNHTQPSDAIGRRRDTSNDVTRRIQGAFKSTQKRHHSRPHIDGKILVRPSLLEPTQRCVSQKLIPFIFQSSNSTLYTYMSMCTCRMYRYRYLTLQREDADISTYTRTYISIRTECPPYVSTYITVARVHVLRSLCRGRLVLLLEKVRLSRDGPVFRSIFARFAPFRPAASRIFQSFSRNLAVSRAAALAPLHCKLAAKYEKLKYTRKIIISYCA